MNGTSVFITYGEGGHLLEKVEYRDRNGKVWNLTDMMFISHIGWSYDPKTGIPTVTLTFDARITEKG